ncbi:hypothetical protein H6P80_16180 [Parasphingopyxis sp. GrpM-11]|uniref:Cytochrome b/b6 C-terminal region profile domain-containing protein n=1 Tax=Parasphingopyxis marina TaxID=2761622 RepID=A0A842I1W2_9SPHN|nr:hypothetical protein [Parasphingopyxis marina]
MGVARRRGRSALVGTTARKSPCFAAISCLEDRAAGHRSKGATLSPDERRGQSCTMRPASPQTIVRVVYFRRERRPLACPSDSVRTNWRYGLRAEDEIMSFPWATPYEPKNPLARWLDDKLPLPRFVFGATGAGYPVPRNLNYFWPFYAILRTFTVDFILPAKLWGVLAMFGSILLLFFLPWLDKSPVRSGRFRPLFRKIYWFGLAPCVLVLGYCGGAPAEQPYLLISQIAAAYYFARFLIILPLVAKIEKPLPLPSSITASVLADGRKEIAPA